MTSKLRLHALRRPNLVADEAVVDGAVITLDGTSIRVDLGPVTLASLAFGQGANRAEAEKVRLTGLHTEVSSGALFLGAGVTFGGAEVRGLKMPGQPVVDLEIKRAAMSVDVLWSEIITQAQQLPQRLALSYAQDKVREVLHPPGAPAPAAPPLPAVLPEDVRIKVELDGPHAAVGLGAGPIGTAGFDNLVVSAVRGGKPVASITVSGMHAQGKQREGGGGGAGATIDDVIVNGQPELLALLLDADLAGLPAAAREALAPLRPKLEPLVRSGGPSVHVSLRNVRVAMGDAVGGATAGTVDGEDIEVGEVEAGIDWQGNRVELSIQGIQGGARGKDAGATVDRCAIRYLNAKGALLASVVIQGVSGLGRAGVRGGGATAKKIEVTGDAGRLPAALLAIEKTVHWMPPPLRDVFRMLERDRIDARGTVQVTNASLEVDAKGGETARGDVAATVKVGATGTMSISIAGLVERQGPGKRLSVHFRSLTARLADANGKVAAMLEAAPGDARRGATDGEVGFKSKLVHMTGDVAGMTALAKAIQKHVTLLPGDIREALATVGELPFAGSADVTLHDLDVSKGKAGPKVGGMMSAHLDVPEVGTIDVHARGGDPVQVAGVGVPIESLDATLAVRGGKQVARVTVDRPAKGDDGGFNVHAEGDTAQIRVLVANLAKMRAKLPSEVTPALALVEKYLALAEGGDARAAIALDNVAVEEGADGKMAATVARLAARAQVDFDDGKGTAFHGADVSFSLSGARLELDAGAPRRVHVEGLTASGRIRGTSPRGPVEGNAEIRTGAATVWLGAGDAPVKIDAADIVASGSLTATAAPVAAVAATPAVAPAPAGPAPAKDKDKPAPLDQAQEAAHKLEPVIRRVDVRMLTPFNPGRYGRIAHLDVPQGAGVEVRVSIKDGVILAGTGVRLSGFREHAASNPVLEKLLRRFSLMVEGDGAHGKLKASVLGGLNLGLYATGKATMPLDLSSLTDEAVALVRKAFADAEPQAAKTVDAAPAQADDDAAWLRKSHAEWRKKTDDTAAGLAGDERARRRYLAEQVAVEPRSASVVDLFVPGSGLYLAATSGHVDVDLVTGDQPVNIAGVEAAPGSELHLHGESKGNASFLLRAQANVSGRSGDTSVDAKGVDTGPVEASVLGDTTRIRFTSFSIKGLHLEIPTKGSDR